MKRQGRAVISWCASRRARDISRAMHAAEGILTRAWRHATSQGRSCARGMGSLSVVGRPEAARRTPAPARCSPRQDLSQGRHHHAQDGGIGQVLEGGLPCCAGTLGTYFAAIMDWADAARRI